MAKPILAHLSDLHLGQSPKRERVARTLVKALLELDEVHVVVTGDVTHRGRHEEAALPDALFAPAGALTAVLLHHHPLPLPEDSLHERLASWLGWPQTL